MADSNTWYWREVRWYELYKRVMKPDSMRRYLRELEENRIGQED